MSYAEQIEAQIAAYPQASSVYVPEALSGIILPAYPHVIVHTWAEDFCELLDASDAIVARFKLVG
jgi:S-adenosylmethionine/arginine decarboxylase-like enzyme